MYSKTSQMTVTFCWSNLCSLGGGGSVVFRDLLGQGISSQLSFVHLKSWFLQPYLYLLVSKLY